MTILVAVPNGFASGGVESRFEGTDVHIEDDLVVASVGRIDDRRSTAIALGADPAASGAELVARAHRVCGTALVEHLLGDYAVVIWERAENVITLVTDPMGTRSLVYTKSADRLVVGTDMAAVLAAKAGPSDPDVEAAAAHLWGVDADLTRTPIRGVRRVPPGAVLRGRPDGLREVRRWHPKIEPIDIEIDEAADRFRSLWLDAVRDRTGGDCGLLLSGGVDSGAIALTSGWLARHGEGRGLRTYSFASERFPSVDERARSSLIVDGYGLASTPVRVDDSAPLTDPDETMPDLDDHFVVEFADALAPALDAAAADGCHTVLSGDRGDLLMSGYVLNPELLVLERRWDDIRIEMDAIVASHGQRAWWDAFGRPALRRVAPRIGRSLRALREPGPVEWRRPMGPTVHVDGTAPEPWSTRRRYDAIFSPTICHVLWWSQRFHARHGVGFADPWSDRRLAEFVLSLPQHIVTPPGTVDAKPLARKTVEPFAAEIGGVEMAKSGPIQMYRDGLQRGRGFVADLMNDSRAADLGLIEPSRYLTSFDRFLAGEHPGDGIWETICVERLLRRLD